MRSYRYEIPRDVSGRQLATLLSLRGYVTTRQKGSHMRLTNTERGAHNATIPDHESLRIGTLKSILTDVATHFVITRKELMEELFGGDV